MEKEPYNQRDHIHCFDQKEPACGSPLENHTYCCLCEKPMENKETNEKCEHGRPTGYCSGCRIDTPVVEKSGWEERFKEHFLQKGKLFFNDSRDIDEPLFILALKDFIKNVEKEAGEKGYADGYADGIEIHKNIQEIARLEGKKEEEQEIKERLTKILKAATGNSGTIAVTPEVIMNNMFPKE